jgi:hypothetical protein
MAAPGRPVKDTPDPSPMRVAPALSSPPRGTYLPANLLPKMTKEPRHDLTAAYEEAQMVMWVAWGGQIIYPRGSFELLGGWGYL